MRLFNFWKRKFTDTNESSLNLEEEIENISETNSSENKSFDKPRKTQLDFVDSSKLVFASIPIRLAKDVPLNSKKSIEESGKQFKFPFCPGMFDYSRVGYIMSSWTDFHFKSNKAGCVSVVGGNKKQSVFKGPVPMDASIVEGLFNLQDKIPLRPLNINSPWKVFCHDPDISAFLLPAWYHSDPEFLDNFYIYPGIVDYNTFHTANVILAPKRKFEYTIKAGDPLLHIIPFYNKGIKCGYGPPTVEQESLISYDPTWHEKQFYRKNHMKKKSYKLEEESTTEEKEE